MNDVLDELAAGSLSDRDLVALVINSMIDVHGGEHSQDRRYHDTLAQSHTRTQSCKCTYSRLDMYNYR